MSRYAFLDPKDRELIAVIAHRLWCDRMRGQGWRYGDQVSAEERTHDALVPFERLTRGDQIAARRAVDARDLRELLTSGIFYTRGPNREFTVEEMTVGLRVLFCPNFEPPAAQEVAGSDVGVVERWELLGDGELDGIWVRWANGSRHVYAPNSGELARLDEVLPPVEMRERGS